MKDEIRHSGTSISNPDYGFSFDEAIKLLAKYKTTSKISRIYDYGKVAEALWSIIPGFEYPDWDYKTLKQALEYAYEIKRLKK